MTDTQPGTEIDTKEFRNALGGFATGVTIVTTLAEDSAGDLRPAAVTANSFASVSLDPPLILWSIARSAQSFQAFEKAEFFAVHILHSAQIGLSNLCATKNADKFGEISWRPGLNGMPIFDDYNTCFQCSVENKYDGGDHVIIVGRVHKFDTSEKAKNAKPLVFYRGAYAGIS